MTFEADYKREEARYRYLIDFIEANLGEKLKVTIVHEKSGQGIDLLSMSTNQASKLLEQELEIARAAYKTALQDRIKEIDPPKEE